MVIFLRRADFHDNYVRFNYYQIHDDIDRKTHNISLVVF